MRAKATPGLKQRQERPRKLQVANRGLGRSGTGAFDESEQIGVDCVGFRRWHAVGEILVGFQYGALYQLGA